MHASGLKVRCMRCSGAQNLSHEFRLSISAGFREHLLQLITYGADRNAAAMCIFLERMALHNCTGQQRFGLCEAEQRDKRSGGNFAVEIPIADHDQISFSAATTVRIHERLDGQMQAVTRVVEG